MAAQKSAADAEKLATFASRQWQCETDEGWRDFQTQLIPALDSHYRVFVENGTNSGTYNRPEWIYTLTFKNCASVEDADGYKVHAVQKNTKTSVERNVRSRLVAKGAQKEAKLKEELAQVRREHADATAKVQEAEAGVARAVQEKAAAESKAEKAEAEAAKLTKLVSTVQLPPTWGDMAPDSTKVVELQAGDPERQIVVQKFNKGFKTGCARLGPPPPVKKVERVQHPALWRQYCAYRDYTVAIGSDTGPNEKQLFHGTDASTMDKINAGANNCFNRTYTETHYYGKGVYFARDASYSANRQYSKPDGSGVQRMYLARVAVGVSTKGNHSMKDAPERDAITHRLYDSVVDQEGNPEIFVVFRDAAAYPEYIITF
jgi:poly [ADP-ribose] polymerase 10/14/15